MATFKETLSSSEAEPAIEEFFATYREELDKPGRAGDSVDIASFLRERGMDAPESGTFSVVFTEATSDVGPMRPVPDCPGGYCVPEPCPDGVGRCGWICYCP